jgi:hypothetical protein
MDEGRKLSRGLICLALTCLVAVAVLWTGGYTCSARALLKNITETRHQDPLKVLLRGILL